MEDGYILTKKHIEQLPIYIKNWLGTGNHYIWQEDWHTLNKYVSAILLSPEIPFNEIIINGMKYQKPYRVGYAKGIQYFDLLSFEQFESKVKFLKQNYQVWKNKSENIFDDLECFEISKESFEKLGYFTALASYCEQWASKEYRNEILEPLMANKEANLPKPNPRTSSAKLRYLEIVNWYIDMRKESKSIITAKNKAMGKYKIGIDTFNKAIKENAQILIGTEFEADFKFLKPKVK
jgi:hypothetical protein